jgi:hypothetical protein
VVKRGEDTLFVVEKLIAEDEGDLRVQYLDGDAL